MAPKVIGGWYERLLKTQPAKRSALSYSTRSALMCLPDMPQHIISAAKRSITSWRDASECLRRAWGQMRASVAGQVGFEMEGLTAVVRAANVSADVLAIDVVVQVTRQAEIGIAVWVRAEVRWCGRYGVWCACVGIWGCGLSSVVIVVF
jgi:hypothetical protein